MLRRIRYFFEWLYVCVHVAAVCLLPRRVAHRIGRWLGGLAYRLSARTRDVALENLKLLLGMDDEAARRTARESCRQAGAALLDLARAPRVGRALALRDVEVPEETRREIDAVRRGGRGVVMATSHFGNWEFHCLAGPFFADMDSTVIIRPVPNPLLNRLLFRLRGRTGQELVDRDAAALVGARRVRAGGAVAVTFDVPVPPGAGAAPVDFFGLPTYTTLAVGYIAALTKAPVYLSYFLPIGGCRYRWVAKGPLQSAPLANTRETALATTVAVSRALEEAIREHPGAWAWWNKRWRLIPPGGTGFPSYARPVESTRRRRDAVADA